MKSLPITLFSFLFLIAPARGQSEAPISDQRIKEATVKLAATYVIGRQYSGNTWHKGQAENGGIGELGTPDDKGVRAVCLGKEMIDGDEYFVFFALRSFVDPFYPSPVIQGVGIEPLDSEGGRIPIPADLSQSTEKSETLDVNWLTPFLRYGRIDFTWYESSGGTPVNKITSKLSVTAFSDPGDIKVVEGPFFGPPSEDYGGGKYPRPQVDFSVKDHFEMQKAVAEGRSAGLRFYEDHDATLIYVPRATFTHQKQPEPQHLGLQHPTIAVDLALHRTEELFGFKFILLGQETLDQIRLYHPEDYELSGMEKAIGILGMAMSPATLNMLQRVDAVLASTLPDPAVISKWTDLRVYYKTLSGQDLGKMGIALVSELLGVPTTMPKR